MKSLIAVACFLSSSIAFAAKPNFYTCLNQEKQISMSYKNSNENSNAVLSFSKLLGTRAEINILAGGEDLREDVSPFGKVIMTLDPRNTIIDEVFTYVGIIIPDINMASNEAEIIFKTQMITARYFTSFAGIDAVKGPLQDTSFTPITCRASR